MVKQGIEHIVILFVGTFRRNISANILHRDYCKVNIQFLCGSYRSLSDFLTELVKGNISYNKSHGKTFAHFCSPFPEYVTSRSGRLYY